MMCQRIGFPPISTIGFGLRCVSSLMRVPKPPARITAFIHSSVEGNNLYCPAILSYRLECLVSGFSNNGTLIKRQYSLEKERRGMRALQTAPSIVSLG